MSFLKAFKTFWNLKLLVNVTAYIFCQFHCDKLLTYSIMSNTVKTYFLL